MLLLACANLANLQLARAGARQREIAVRTALGASPGRVVRQLLVESLVLSLSGAGLGVLGAIPAVQYLSRLAAERVSVIDGIRLDPVVLGVALFLGVLAGVLFGLAPALRGARVDLAANLKESARATGAASSLRLNDAFVVSQLALSVVLLVGAGLLLKSFARLMDVNPGFEPRNAVVGRIAVPFTRFQDMAQVRRLVDPLVERVRVLPGVTAAGISSTAPFSSNDNQQELIVQGHAIGPGEQWPVASIRRGVDRILRRCGDATGGGTGIYGRGPREERAGRHHRSERGPALLAREQRAGWSAAPCPRSRSCRCCAARSPRPTPICRCSTCVHSRRRSTAP